MKSINVIWSCRESHIWPILPYFSGFLGVVENPMFHLQLLFFSSFSFWFLCMFLGPYCGKMAYKKLTKYVKCSVNDPPIRPFLILFNLLGGFAPQTPLIGGLRPPNPPLRGGYAPLDPPLLFYLLGLRPKPHCWGRYAPPKPPHSWGILPHTPINCVFVVE